MDKSINDGSSDYGSDFTTDEEALISDLLAKAAAEHTATPVPLPVVPLAEDIESYAGPIRTQPLRALAKMLQESSLQLLSEDSSHLGCERPGQEPRYGNVALVENCALTEGRDEERERRPESGQNAPNIDPGDTRSPLDRLRKPPNKALSVTDLVSPAWCELQYWYSLTKFGRKRRTAAMKRGSAIHKVLEDEIHTTVPVKVTTKEDAFALRIWNIIQGLRTLRDFGVTREFEVWGVVDGELVNGVIDQLSYECPDPEMEAFAATYYAGAESSRRALPEYQMSLADYLLSPPQGGRRLSDMANGDHEQVFPSDRLQSYDAASRLRRVYLSDTKTRVNPTVPSLKSASFRPTSLQLQLYYHMLNRMITSNDVSIELLSLRYKLYPDRPFTSTFMREIESLTKDSSGILNRRHANPPSSCYTRAVSRGPDSDESESSSSSNQDSAVAFLEYNNLTRLWTLMKDQLRLTFLPKSPPSAAADTSEPSPSVPATLQPAILDPYPTLLSPLLTAEFVSAAVDMGSGSKLLGRRSFLFDTISLTSYLNGQMEWWRGKRPPRGVDTAEAWKCQICEFRDICYWRKEMEVGLATGGSKLND